MNPISSLIILTCNTASTTEAYYSQLSLYFYWFYLSVFILVVGENQTCCFREFWGWAVWFFCELRWSDNHLLDTLVELCTDMDALSHSGVSCNFSTALHSCVHDFLCAESPIQQSNIYPFSDQPSSLQGFVSDFTTTPVLNWSVVRRAPNSHVGFPAIFCRLYDLSTLKPWFFSNYEVEHSFFFNLAVVSGYHMLDMTYGRSRYRVSHLLH